MKKLNQQGQIIVEYILVLIVAVSIAALITKAVVHRDPEDPGFLIEVWDNMVKTIGNDLN